jgi:hypothetical protein
VSALLASEIRRMLSRRLVRVVVALAVLGILIAAVVVAVKSTEGLSPFGIDRRFHLTALRGALEGTSPILIIASWLLGASFIGADWHTGTVTTLLTWEPRRGRLLLAKAAACVGVVFVLVMAVQAVLAGSLTVAAVLRGTTEGTTGPWIRSAAGIAVRVGAMSAVGAAIGFAIASVSRNTAAALGVGFGYVVVIENLVRGLRPQWTQWLLADNAVILITGRSDGLVVHRSVMQAGLLLGLYAALLVLVAVAVFRARDVA